MKRREIATLIRRPRCNDRDREQAVSDRRYTVRPCPCGDAWCAGCEDADIKGARFVRDANGMRKRISANGNTRTWCRNCGVALDVGGGCAACAPYKTGRP